MAYTVIKPYSEAYTILPAFAGSSRTIALSSTAHNAPKAKGHSWAAEPSFGFQDRKNYANSSTRKKDTGSSQNGAVRLLAHFFTAVFSYIPTQDRSIYKLHYIVAQKAPGVHY